MSLSTIPEDVVTIIMKMLTPGSFLCLLLCSKKFLRLAEPLRKEMDEKILSSSIPIVRVIVVKSLYPATHVATYKKCGICGKSDLKCLWNCRGCDKQICTFGQRHVLIYNYNQDYYCLKCATKCDQCDSDCMIKNIVESKTCGHKRCISCASDYETCDICFMESKREQLHQIIPTLSYHQLRIFREWLK
jgi:hypothetical protein